MKYVPAIGERFYAILTARGTVHWANTVHEKALTCTGYWTTKDKGKEYPKAVLCRDARLNEIILERQIFSFIPENNI